MPPKEPIPLLFMALFKRKKKEVGDDWMEDQDKFADILRPKSELSGVDCLACGSANLIVAKDGSAICKDCGKAFQELVPPQ